LSVRDLAEEQIDTSSHQDRSNTLPKDQGKPGLKRVLSLPAVATGVGPPLLGLVPIMVDQKNNTGSKPSKKGLQGLFRNLRQGSKAVEQGGPDEAHGRVRSSRRSNLAHRDAWKGGRVTRTTNDEDGNRGRLRRSTSTTSLASMVDMDEDEFIGLPPVKNISQSHL
jgi:hypothetical protein